MLPLAYFGIESNAFNLVIDLLILFAVVLYLSLLYWTYADARRRILDPVMIALGVVVSLVPFLGTLIYIILRPPEYLEDVRERELETRAAEARLHGLDYQLCPHCDYRVERDFVRCPSCLRKLKERCVNCSRPLDRAWTICPYCETEVPAELAPRRRTRRRSAAGAEEPASGDGATRAGEPATRSGDPTTRVGEASARRGESSARPVRGAVTGLDGDLARESVVLSEPPAPDDPPAPPRPRASGRASRPPGRSSAPELLTHRRRSRLSLAHIPIASTAKELMDRTLILVKPDAFARSLTGEIIARFERKGLRLVALRQMTIDRELAERHYAEHAQRPFFGELVDFITSGPLVAMVLEGSGAVKAARQAIGATNPLEAAPGSIRGDFAVEMGRNMVHGSDSPESAARESALFFPELA